MSTGLSRTGTRAHRADSVTGIHRYWYAAAAAAVIDGHSSSLIRVIRAHKRIPGGRPLSGCRLLRLRRSLTCISLAHFWKFEQGGGEGCGSYLRFGRTALLPAHVRFPASVTRLGHESARARSRRIAILRECHEINGDGRERRAEERKSLFYFCEGEATYRFFSICCLPWETTHTRISFDFLPVQFWKILFMKKLNKTILELLDKTFVI